MSAYVQVLLIGVFIGGVGTLLVQALWRRR